MRYRYYISSALIQGQPDKAAKLNRVPATEIEKLILSAVRKHLAGKPHNKAEAEGPDSLNDKELISAHVARVDVKRDHLAIQLSAKSDERRADRRHQQNKTSAFIAIHMCWSSPGKRLRQNDRGRLFSPRRHPLIPTPVQSAPKPAPSSSPRSRRGGIGSMS